MMTTIDDLDYPSYKDVGRKQGPYLVETCRIFLSKVCETFWNYQLKFGLRKYIPKLHCNLQLDIDIPQPNMKFLGAVKPWMFVNRQITISTGSAALNLVTLVAHMRLEDITRIKELLMHGESHLANIFSKCSSIKAVKVVLGKNAIIYILAVTKLSQFKSSGKMQLSKLGNIEPKKLSTLRIFDVVLDQSESDGGRKTFKHYLKVLEHLSILGIQYCGPDLFGEISDSFPNLYGLSASFSQRGSRIRIISRMPVLRKLSISCAVFEWPTLAAACPHLQLLVLRYCEIIGSCDVTHALCLKTLHLISVNWHSLKPHTLSYISQIAAYVLEDLYIYYRRYIDLRGPDAMTEWEAKRDRAMVNEFRMLMENPRLIAGCKVMICFTRFKTARFDRIRLYLFSHMKHLPVYP